MARRADHTQDEIRRMAVDAGVRLLKEAGPGGLGARKIAAEIGYSVGTLYNLFGSYEMLRLHIKGVALDEWHEAIRQVLAGNPDDPLMALSRFYIRYSTEHASQWRLIFNDATVSAPVPDWYKEKIARLFGALETLVAPYAESGPVCARQAARLLWTGIHGIAALSLSGKLALVGTDDADTLAACFITTFRAGLQPPLQKTL